MARGPACCERLLLWLMGLLWQSTASNRRGANVSEGWPWKPGAFNHSLSQKKQKTLTLSYYCCQGYINVGFVLFFLFLNASFHAKQGRSWLILSFCVRAQLLLFEISLSSLGFFPGIAAIAVARCCTHVHVCAWAWKTERLLLPAPAPFPSASSVTQEMSTVRSLASSMAAEIVELFFCQKTQLVFISGFCSWHHPYCGILGQFLWEHMLAWLFFFFLNPQLKNSLLRLQLPCQCCTSPIFRIQLHCLRGLKYTFRRHFFCVSMRKLTYTLNVSFDLGKF